MKRIVSLIAVLMIVLTLFVPVSEASFKIELTHWSDFARTSIPEFGVAADIRYESTDVVYSAPDSIRIRFSAAGYVDFTETSEIYVEYWIRTMNVGDEFAVYVMKGHNQHYTNAVQFWYKQVEHDTVDLIIWDVVGGDKTLSHTDRITNISPGQWVKVRSQIFNKYGGISFEKMASHEVYLGGSWFGISTKNIYTREEGMPYIQQRTFSVAMFRPNIFSIVYLDDIIVQQKTDDDNPGPFDDPTVVIPENVPVIGGKGIGGLPLLVLLSGFILAVAYYLGIIPMPNVKKGRIRMVKRRK